MISVSKAKELIIANCTPLNAVRISIGEMHGKILGQDIFSNIDIPGYPQSSMDGYAFNYRDYKNNNRLKIAGKIAAGDDKEISLNAGEAARIFTGAPVPAYADTVVMQEKCLLDHDTLIIMQDDIRQADHVRAIGAEIKKDSLALESGTLLTPGAIGFLAGIGVAEALVYPLPVVTIIVTGNELQPPGLPLHYGQVYESNSFALEAALHVAGIQALRVIRATDDLATITSMLKDAVEQSDVVLLTGGVSAGDYDFVIEATLQCTVKKIFHKIKQKPGKPLYFGRKENKLVFGLPGNPSSVLSCFYQYVLPALNSLSHHTANVSQVCTTLQTAVKKSAGLTHFLKGYYDGRKVLPLHAQESFRMHSFAKANCLIEINEDVTQLDAGEKVTIHLLPGC